MAWRRNTSSTCLVRAKPSTKSSFIARPIPKQKSSRQSASSSTRCARKAASFCQNSVHSLANIPSRVAPPIACGATLRAFGQRHHQAVGPPEGGTIVEEVRDRKAVAANGQQV